MKDRYRGCNSSFFCSSFIVHHSSFLKECLPMARKRSRPPASDVSSQPAAGSDRLIPNLSLSRAARAGEATEDELLLQRPRRHRPEPRVPEQAEFTRQDTWRVLRIMGEYVHGFDALAGVGAAVAVFGSARTRESDPMYQAARETARRL